MYPVYRKALSSTGPSDSVIGARGIARERIAPSGYILVRGELWRARLREGSPAVEEGDPVRVLKIEGLTLEIVPEREE
jgi:membrane-bound serine protease (ClpP class)